MEPIATPNSKKSARRQLWLDAVRSALMAKTYWLDVEMRRAMGTLAGRHGALAVGLLSVALAFFLYAPPFWLGLLNPEARIGDFVRQAHDPLTTQLNEPILYFRPIHGAITFALGLREPLAVLVFPLCYGIAFVSLLYVYLKRITAPAVAGLFCLAISTTQAVQVTTSWLGYPDALAWCFAMLMLLAPRSVYAVALVPLAVLTDERVVFTFPFILLLRLKGGWRSVRAWVGEVAPIAVGLLLAFLARNGLSSGSVGKGVSNVAIYDLLLDRLSNVVSPYVADKPWLVPLALFFSFRFLWILPVLAVLKCRRRDDSIVQILSFGALLVAAYAVFIGGDWTRSLACLFPIFVVAVVQLERREPGSSWRPLLAALALNAFTPMLNIDWAPGRTGLVRPMLLSLLRAWTGWDVGMLFR